MMQIMVLHHSGLIQWLPAAFRVKVTQAHLQFGYNQSFLLSSHCPLLETLYASKTRQCGTSSTHLGEVTLPLCPQILNFKLLSRTFTQCWYLVAVIPQKVTVGINTAQIGSIIVDGFEDFRLNAIDSFMKYLSSASCVL